MLGTNAEEGRRTLQDSGLDVTLVEDLAGARPADRLICGDVGFGKTEVALRAAFIATFAGKQVAVVVPTTLLCRQHYRTFKERFAGYPVRVGQLSRLVAARDAKLVKEGIAGGDIDIVIGTHALLAGDLRFRDLGLLVIDEEQHFGVSHKEKLKKLRADVHVITLTATPIPRTLQLALSGVKDMSLIATPPVDRLAVRTFVLPFDPVVIGEAIRRERYRGGQTFYVCPRIRDLAEIRETLAELAPDISVVTAHGRLAPRELEDSISAFYDGEYDLLLSTNIIESGLDLPRVNTIIIHRADRFGLAQLYQLRGRVGRSKARAYAYLTLPRRQGLTPAATKRLEVMQTLDSLGAGFSLASHDLDIRGAGNLLGGEQSGHIREVGIELYQQMLEEAVAEARGLETSDEDWSPSVAIGLAVLIPETYIADLTLRMDLYRRLARLTEKDEIDAFAAEIIDRFGSLPEEVENLLRTVEIKGLAKADILLFSAGSSVSSRDMTAEVIGSLGRPGVLVHGISIRPGKPTIVGLVDGKPAFGLPGNPVSAMVVFDLLVRPTIHLLGGRSDPLEEATVRAKLLHNIASVAGREDYVPVKLLRRNGSLCAEPIFGKSNLIYTLVRADGIVKVPLDAGGLYEDEEIQVRLF